METNTTLDSLPTELSGKPYKSTILQYKMVIHKNYLAIYKVQWQTNHMSVYVCVHVKTRGHSGHGEETGGAEDTVVVKKCNHTEKQVLPTVLLESQPRSQMNCISDSLRRHHRPPPSRPPHPKLFALFWFLNLSYWWQVKLDSLVSR